MRLIYSSSPDRGLLNLLRWWTEYKDCTLDIYYGFENLEKSQPDSPVLKEVRHLIDLYDAVTYHGRIGQDQLAKEFLSHDAWVYPTEFSETYCITALEAQLAKCMVLCPKLAGLATTARGGVFIDEDVTTREWHIVANTILHVYDKQKIEQAYQWARRQTWKRRADEWLKIFQII